MIKTENIIIKGKEYVKTYSDAGMMIARDGKKFSVAIEPISFVRKYVETDKPIPVARTPKEPARKPIYREATPMKPVEEETIPTEPTETTEPAVVEEAAEMENLEIAETKEETTEQVE